MTVSATTNEPDRSTRHVLVLVENLSVPFDRRVWQESRALVDAGYQVTVICPLGKNQDREAGGIDRRRPHPPLPAASRDGWATGIPARVWRRPVAHDSACAPCAARRARARRPRVQPSRSALPRRHRAADPWHALRVRPARPRPGVVPVEVPRTRRPAVLVHTVARTVDVRRCRRRDLDERELSAHRHREGAEGS